MGNTNSNVSSGVKDQAAGGGGGLYKYINLTGGGEIVELMKIASKTKDFKEVDQLIVDGLKQFMYNEDGASIIVHVSKIVTAKRRMNPNTDAPDKSEDINAMIEANKGNPDWWKAPGKDLSVIINNLSTLK